MELYHGSLGIVQKPEIRKASRTQAALLVHTFKEAKEVAL